MQSGTILLAVIIVTIWMIFGRGLLRSFFRKISQTVANTLILKNKKRSSTTHPTEIDNR
jgi:hypothetical protein